MASLIERSTHFTSLPREYYYSPEIYEREIERIYHRQWQFFGHVSQLPNPGDYLAREIAGESLIAIRGTDGEVRVFFNFCRHRGAELCPLGAGNARRARITCPYHQWTYDADGRLLNAPSIPDGGKVDYADWGLVPAQFEVWQGFLFICLGDEPLEPLSQIFASCNDKFARLEPERLKLARMISYDMAANWKLAMENGECYHCTVGHPELCQVMDSTGYDDVDFRWQEGWAYDTADYPMRPGVQSITIDGRFATTKLLGEFGRSDTPPAEAEGYNAGIYIQPARTSISAFADHIDVFAIYPVSVDRSEWINWWFVREDAQEGVDYDVDKLSSLMDATVRQDVALCELTQRGNKSRRYAPGPLSEAQETPVRAALTTYLKWMGEDDA